MADSIKGLIKKIEVSERVCRYLWNTAAPSFRFTAPLKEATENLKQLASLVDETVAIDWYDLQRINELQEFFKQITELLTPISTNKVVNG